LCNLAQRSGQFKTINTTDVKDGELVGRDRMTGDLTFNWTDVDNRGDLPVIGYLAYFELLTGFRKSLYMSKEEVEDHAGRYSQAFNKNSNSNFKTPWQTDFDLMAQKTVLKQLLSKYGPLSTEMPDIQKAIEADQSTDDGNGYQYPDNPNRTDDVADVGATDGYAK
jgi:recombination protein RecT